METADRILNVALDLLDRDGAAALTTRAVCEAAKITAPTLYHHFADKDGLQRALAERVTAEFLKHKRSLRTTSEALDDLKRGWNAWIEFGLAHPNRLRLIFEAGRTAPLVQQAGYDLLRSIIERLAAEGRLGTDPQSATRTVWAASNGVLMLLLKGETAAHIRSSSALMLESLIARLVD